MEEARREIVRGRLFFASDGCLELGLQSLEHSIDALVHLPPLSPKDRGILPHPVTSRQFGNRLLTPTRFGRYKHIYALECKRRQREIGEHVETALLQEIEDAAEVTARFLLAWSVVRVLLAHLERPFPPLPRLRVSLPGGVAALGVAGALMTPRIEARAQGSPFARRISEPPWSRTSGFPPPYPLVRAGAPEASDDRLQTRSPASHPAIHEAGEAAGSPHGLPRLLFPSVTGRAERARSLRAAVKAHPAGKGRRDESARSSLAGLGGLYELPDERDCVRRYTVRPDDTLWSISEKVLETREPARVARFWPRIHRLNRAVIGADPSLIMPGQVLELPDECDAG